MAVQYCQVHPLPHREGQERCVQTSASSQGIFCGLIGKLILGNLSYVVFFYIADILIVAADLVLTLRNRRLDRERDKV